MCSTAHIHVTWLKGFVEAVLIAHSRDITSGAVCAYDTLVSPEVGGETDVPCT